MSDNMPQNVIDGFNESTKNMQRAPFGYVRSDYATKTGTARPGFNLGNPDLTNKVIRPLIDNFLLFRNIPVLRWVSPYSALQIGADVLGSIFGIQNKEPFLLSKAEVRQKSDKFAVYGQMKKVLKKFSEVEEMMRPLGIDSSKILFPTETAYAGSALSLLEDYLKALQARRDANPNATLGGVSPGAPANPPPAAPGAVLSGASAPAPLPETVTPPAANPAPASAPPNAVLSGASAAAPIAQQSAEAPDVLNAPLIRPPARPGAPAARNGAGPLTHHR